MDIFLLVCGMLALLLMKGFFSGSEIALVSSDKLKLKSEADKGAKGAALVLRLFERPETLLATTLIGTNISTMTLAVLGTVTFMEILGDGGDIYATLILAPIMLIFGEIVPKSVFQQRSATIAPIVVRPLAIMQVLLLPLVLLFGWTGRRITTLVGPRDISANPYVTRQRLRLMLENADRAAGVKVLDRDRIRRAIRLSDMSVGDAMLPLVHVVGAPLSVSKAELLSIVRDSGHRRIPLYDGNISSICSVAVWTIWDEANPDFLNEDVGKIAAEPHFASPVQPLDELLTTLLARSDRMAVVVDEFGTALGILTLEDVMAALLGRVAYESHVGPKALGPEGHIERVGDNSFIADARARLADISELLDIALPAREFHSVSGLFISRLRRIPLVGDSIEEGGYRFTIVEATTRMPTRVRIESSLGSGLQGQDQVGHRR